MEVYLRVKKIITVEDKLIEFFLEYHYYLTEISMKKSKQLSIFTLANIHTVLELSCKF